MANKANNGGMSQLADQVEWALKNSRGGMGGMAAMMGVPLQQKAGGQWMTIDPRRQSIYPSGTTPPPMQPSANPDAPKAGGDGPAVNPNDEAMLKAGLTPWWIDWRNQYGGPTKGLLDD